MFSILKALKIQLTDFEKHKVINKPSAKVAKKVIVLTNKYVIGDVRRDLQLFEFVLSKQIFFIFYLFF